MHRVNGTKSRTYEGSGIGLALVQELVKRHGGTIRVTSQVDCGTTFAIALPVGSCSLDSTAIKAALATNFSRERHWHAMQQIRALEQGRQIPAIALTAYAGEFNRQQALTAGFQRHLAKPIEPDELVKAVETLVKEHYSCR